MPGRCRHRRADIGAGDCRCEAPRSAGRSGTSSDALRIEESENAALQSAPRSQTEGGWGACILGLEAVAVHGVFVAVGSGILTSIFYMALWHRLLLRCKPLPPQIDQSELGCGARSFRFPTNPLAICSVGGNVFLAGSLARFLASEVTPLTKATLPQSVVEADLSES